MKRDNSVVCSFSLDVIDKKDSIVVEKIEKPFYRTTVKKEYLKNMHPKWVFVWTTLEMESVQKNFLDSSLKDTSFENFLNTSNIKLGDLPIKCDHKDVIKFLKKC